MGCMYKTLSYTVHVRLHFITYCHWVECWCGSQLVSYPSVKVLNCLSKASLSKQISSHRRLLFSGHQDGYGYGATSGKESKVFKMESQKKNCWNSIKKHANCTILKTKHKCEEMQVRCMLNQLGVLSNSSTSTRQTHRFSNSVIRFYFHI